MNKMPIISRYVAIAKNRLALAFKGKEKAKMEGKLHSKRSEIDGRFVNFFLIL